VPGKAVYRSSFPGRCTLQPGPETIRSTLCHRDPAYRFSLFLRVKKARKEAASRSGFRTPGTPAVQWNSQQGLRSPCRTQDKENQKEA